MLVKRLSNDTAWLSSNCSFKSFAILIGSKHIVNLYKYGLTNYFAPISNSPYKELTPVFSTIRTTVFSRVCQFISIKKAPVKTGADRFNKL
jgi:hypothetical protein